MASEPILIDSNVLIRWVHPKGTEYPLVRRAIQHIEDAGRVPCYTSQNLAEFWNVLTRPADRNGYGLAMQQVVARAEQVESRFALLPDGPRVHTEWRRLLVEYAVRGVQVHDARIAAAMLVHSVRRILTFNTRDFARFDGIEAVHPSQFV